MPLEPWAAHLVYALAWLSFGAGHSWLANADVKARLRPWLGAGERLAYNLFAVVHVGLVLAVGWWALGDAPSFALPGWLEALMLAVSALGLILLLVFARSYDLGRFAGTHQLRMARREDASAAEAADDEPLQTDGIHAWVRHPLYSAAFLVLWGRAVDPLGLATAVWASLYLLIGSRFEERRLLRLYGEAYARYREKVPAFVPWRGRASTGAR
ncbi:methyltransferase family protein [Caenispirillum salinarum]|uniref:methyltransferase family protein n=1 Tax=Caenispirillum salinarum TaxID=859058 RepID=UPI00384C3C7C